MNQFQIHIQFQSNWKYNSESNSIEIQIQIENELHSNLKFQPNCQKQDFQFSIFNLISRFQKLNPYPKLFKFIMKIQSNEIQIQTKTNPIQLIITN